MCLETDSSVRNRILQLDPFSRSVYVVGNNLTGIILGILLFFFVRARLKDFVVYDHIQSGPFYPPPFSL